MSETQGRPGGNVAGVRPIVEQLVAWYQQHHTELEARLSVSLERSPDGGRPKTAAWVNVGRGDATAQIIV